MQEPQPPEVALKKLHIAQLLSGCVDIADQCNELREVTSLALIVFGSTHALSAAWALATNAPPIEICIIRVSSLRRDSGLLMCQFSSGSF
jgi:hypothetical protein